MKPKNSIDILFVILDIGLMVENSAVFQAQVVDQAVALRKIGYSVCILCAYKQKDEFQRVAGDKLESEGVSVDLIHDRGLVGNLISFATALRNKKKNYHVSTGYVRGFWGAVAILLSGPLRIMSYVYDERGDIVDESAARGRAKHRLFVIQLLEKLSLRRARYVTSVTNRLANIVKERAKLRVSPIVIPSCIDINEFLFEEEKRTIRREQLGYSESDIVFIYSGGLSHYQMIPEMLALWRGISSLSPNVKFLLLINSDPSSLERTVGNIADFGDKLQIINLPRTEVFKTLSAADIGFLLRENRELNATASPVKFAEYLAAGLSVVSSPGVGDLSSLIIDRQVGILIAPKKVMLEIDAVSEFLRIYKENRLIYRANSLRLANERYNWDAHKQSFEVLYGKPELSNFTAFSR